VNQQAIKEVVKPLFADEESLRKTLKATVQESIAEVIAAAQVVVPTKPFLAAEIPPPSLETLHLFRRFLDDPDAAFRSPEQGIAFDLVVRCVTSALIVLPTGMGKSLLFIFSAWLISRNRRDTSFVAVFVPYKCLMEDLVRRSQDMNVRVTRMSFKDGDEPEHMLEMVGTSLVLISADQGSAPSMVDFLKHAKKSNRLKCMFIDECHLLFDPFRERLKKLAVEDEVGVPLFLNTGSITHADEQRLLEMFSKYRYTCNSHKLTGFNRD
jgi:superfamily II DNA helicase RecQ